jgi:hypothetical protein
LSNGVSIESLIDEAVVIDHVELSIPLGVGVRRLLIEVAGFRVGHFVGQIVGHFVSISGNTKTTEQHKKNEIRFFSSSKICYRFVFSSQSCSTTILLIFFLKR